MITTHSIKGINCLGVPCKIRPSFGTYVSEIVSNVHMFVISIQKNVYHFFHSWLVLFPEFLQHKYLYLIITVHLYPRDVSMVNWISYDSTQL